MAKQNINGQALGFFFSLISFGVKQDNAQTVAACKFGRDKDEFSKIIEKIGDKKRQKQRQRR